MAIAIVQTKTAPTLINDQFVTLDAAATNGNVLIVVAHCASAGQTISITDNGGSITWASVVAKIHSVSTQLTMEIFWGTVSGAPTVITANSSGAGGTGLHVVEISGLSASPADVSGTGESTTVMSHNISAGITPSQADVILVGGVVSTNAATYTLPGSFARIDIAGDRSDSGTDIVSSIAAYDFGTTSAGNEITVTVLAAFKGASTAVSLTPTQAAAALTGTTFGMGFKINMPDEL